MKRSGISLAITALALTAGAGLTACSQSADEPSPRPSAEPDSSRIQDASTATAPISDAPAPTAAHRNPATPDSSLADGRHPARITAIDPDGAQLTIDVVQFFFGEAATEAARADGSTDLPPPNDHWIRNVNPELRTLPIAPHAPVTVNALSWPDTGSTTSTAISLSKLASYGDVRGSLFWVTTRDGAVTSIAEQFLP
jgi:hypothetical protein